MRDVFLRKYVYKVSKLKVGCCRGSDSEQYPILRNLPRIFNLSDFAFPIPFLYILYIFIFNLFYIKLLKYLIK